MAPILAPVKPIGPYVAARDLTGDRPAGAVRTLRATDRLTGMPVLLHVLPHAAPLPGLPPDPALLPPSEGGIDGDTAYVVTELPPHAVPASDPLLAARGALAGLAALHEAGLAHGGVGTAQLWSMDGRVALAGAALPWGGEATPARDLRDLTDTLGTLGEVPQALRDLPAGATARDLLARLDASPPARVTRRRDAAQPVPAASERAQSSPPQGSAPATPVPLSDPPASRLVVAAVPAEPVQVVQVGSPEAPSPVPAQPVSAEVGATAEAPNSPLEGEGASPTAARSPTGRVPARRLSGEPVRIAWDADGTRRVVKPGREAAPPPRRARRRAPGWLLPLLALLLLLLLAGVWWAQRGASAPVPTAAASPTCCEVRFKVQGAGGVPVRLGVVSAPAGSGFTPGQEVGQAPGVVRLPRRGKYTLRVSAQGYTPETVVVTAPSSRPVPITLTP